MKATCSISFSFVAALTMGMLLTLAADRAHAQLDPTISTVDTERYAYGANVGWVNFRWDTSSPGEGAAVTDAFMAGYVYGANFGWIDLGDGAPENGIQYQNTVVMSNNDFGVNHDGAGNLSGYGYGANIGWVNFGWDGTGMNPSRPQVNLVTGNMSGYAYGANVGWIDLGTNGVVVVKTGTIEFTDSDSDGISDSWELEQIANAGMSSGNTATDLMVMNATSNNDGDHESDLAEYIADTNPFDADEFLRVTNYVATDPPATTNIDISWASTPTRLYDVKVSTTGLVPGDFTTTVTPNVVGSATGTSSQSYADPLTGGTSGQKFWKVEAKLPLAPP